MATSTRQQPPWQPPPIPDQKEAQLPSLKIWNSLTRSKTPFVPLDWRNRTVTWYACGPTVYDDAHLGHARNYVSTDIIRRILRDYFKYKVKFIMNITDVDDKIIVRGRQQHLLAQFISKRSDLEHNGLETSLAALKAYLTKNLPRISPDIPPAQIEEQVRSKYGAVLQGDALEGGVAGDKEAKVKMHIKTVLAASKAIVLLQDSSIGKEDFYTETQDILLPYLDSLHGSSIDADDHTIFTRLTQKFETRFMEDVRSLGCLDPDEVTRVTEYSQQIVDFVEKIEENGFAYATSDGSVYFDIEAFEAAHNNYARLEPWNRNDTELQADGEGALSKKSSEKRSDADFALWKSSKPGEPSWPSPWGRGRPGWHIECSAMASDKLGSQIDIHSGGIDLAFPHHDNELAQSEAFWLDKSHEHQHQWVNYFMHMGHLSIQGSKMSKSLKNFTTIREALAKGDWTPRGLRIVFLLGGWKEGIEITGDVIKAGTAWEDKLNNFFINAIDVLDRRSPSTESASGGEIEQSVNDALAKASRDTYDALCDSFNTPLVMATISELISTYNTADKSQVSPSTTAEVAKWVTSLVNIFGLDGTSSPPGTTIGWSGIAIAEAGKPYVYPLSAMRDELRRKARSANGLTPEDIQSISKSNDGILNTQKHGAERFAQIVSKFETDLHALTESPTLSKEVLQLCDRLRDVDLWDQGIYLEDRDGNQPALVRPVTRELLAARQDKEERERVKQQAKESREKEAIAKADKGQLSQLQMFRTSEYSAWDGEGLPLKDAQGEEITKSRAKKLRKDWERQKKLHEAWQKSRGS
ncbi:hypothetical protein MMC24_007639 [Lignoscripta atroalba]|nr:hypothetical protein [Lignoscripta atroalba]